MNKKIILLFVYFLFNAVILLYADDVIVFRNGDILNGIVIEITPSEVKYKKASNPNGPTYTSSKGEILSIKYDNGDIDKFEDSINQDKLKSVSVIHALPDEYNDFEKTLYSTGNYTSSKKITSNAAKAASFFLKFTDKSIISSKDLTIKFEPGFCQDDKWFSRKNKIPYWVFKQIGTTQYRIHVSNKTDRPIYLDLGKSSKQDEINGYITYYDGSKEITSTGNSSGIGLNLGLITVGGGSSESTSIIQNGNRFVIIYPHTTFIIPSKKKIIFSDPYMYYETFSNYVEEVPFAYKFNDLKERETKFYTETDSPIKVNYKLTYSYDDNFDNPIEMDFTLYAFQVIGLPSLFDKKWGAFRDTYKNFGLMDILGDEKVQKNH